MLEQPNKSREKFLDDIADAFTLQGRQSQAFQWRFPYEGLDRNIIAKNKGIETSTLDHYLKHVYEAFTKSPEKPYGCDFGRQGRGRGKYERLWSWLWTTQFLLWKDDYPSWKAQFPTLQPEFWESPSEQERKRAEIAEIELLNSQSQSLLLSHDQLGALLAAVKAGKKLQETEAPADIKMQTVCRLWQILYKIRERNRLEKHSHFVEAVSFSPNGRFIASASYDKTVKVHRLWE